MRRASMVLTIVRQVAFAIALCTTVTLHAQAAKSDDQEGARKQGIPAESDESRQGSLNSLTLPRRQSVIQCFELIRQSIDRNDYPAAIPLIERVLSEPNSFVPTINATEVASHEEVWRLVDSMPTQVRQRFDEPRRIAGKRSWDDAKTKGIDAVSQFLEQYSDVPLATEAWWWIGCHERELGRPIRAAAAFERSAWHPHAGIRQRVIGLLVSLDALLQANRPQDVRRIRSALEAMDANLALEIAGKPTTLGQYLNTALPSQTTDNSAPQTAEISPAKTDWRHLRPVTLPVWKQELTPPLREALETREEKQREQGIRPVPIVRPLIVGQHVIIRALDLIHAFELSTGKPLWTVRNLEFQQIGNTSPKNTASMGVLTDWAQRRTQADSIFGRISTDNRRLFVIQERDRSGELRIDRESPRGLLRTGPRFNSLWAYSVDDGATEWGEGAPPTDNSTPLSGFVFLGSPFIQDNFFYTVAQRETEISLLTFTVSDGKLQSSIPLGTGILTLEEDLQRSRVACPIVWHCGLLLCSTSAGALVAVDPLLQSLKWAYRYSASTVAAADLAQTPNQAASANNQETWWESWREPFAEIARSRSQELERTRGGNSAPNLSTAATLVFASPETEELHAIQLPSGEPLWKTPRNGGLFVAGVSEKDGVIVVIEGDAARGHDLGTGRQLWRTMTGDIGGPATLVGSVLVQPILSGGTVLVDAQNGQLLSDASSTDLPLGALAETDNGWIAFNRQSVMLLPRLGDIRNQVEQELRNDPQNESLRVRASLLDLQAGEVESARRRLDGLTSSPARDLRRQALIAALGRETPEHSGSLRSELAKELNELADNADYRFAAAAAIGTSALAVNDLVATVDSALAGLSNDLGHSDSLVKRTAVLARKDRVLLGLIDEAYRRTKPSEKESLDDLFSRRVALARKSRDGLSLQQVAESWRGIDWARRVFASDDDKVFRRRSFFEIEFRLLDAAGAEDPAVAVQALDQLATRCDRLGMTQDSRAIRRRILREFPSARLPDGQTEIERIDNDPTLRESIRGTSKPIWPDTRPRIDPPRKERNFGVYCPLVPIHAEPDSLAARLDVAVDRTGSEVFFRGESFFQSGEDEDHERRLPLPKTMSPYRGPSGYMLREGWGIGRVVILLVGSELFAIAPLDQNGDPDSRFLWSHPIDLKLPFGGTKTSPPRQGIHDERRIVVNDANRPIGKVGPVRAGYLCYQSGGKLVAAETETGRELWQRPDVPTEATILGDDHQVYIWHDANSLEIVSAIDGRKLENGASPGPPETMIHHRGNLVWTASRGETLTTQLYDLKTGRLVWSRSDPARSLIAVLDAETLAVATPDGQLNLLQARTATPLSPPLSVNCESMTEITAWHDAERWYVALSRPVDNLATLKSLQPNDGYRLRFLHGPLYAVDRLEPRILWQREMKNEPMSLEQSRGAPVLLQLWKLAAKGSNEASKGTLRVIDKRNGTDLLERNSVDILPYFLLNPDPQQAILELKLTQETIRFHYAEDDQPVEEVKRSPDTEHSKPE